jgi:fatty-acyl-CoA synthase
LDVAAAETVLVVVPMFHVNAWGIPYSATMCGAKLVLPGPGLDGRSIYELLKSEQVTLALGVPTVWMMLLDYAESLKTDAKSELALRRVVIGGSAAPRAMGERFERMFGAFVAHAWGMTETSPIGTVCNLLAKHRGYSLDQRLDLQVKQGRPLFGVDLKITDGDGERLPHDGKAFGHLMIRGPWVTAGYFKDEGAGTLDAEGYFDTGDIATIDPDGYIQITDRAKDVIKSGGEWISSIALENAAIGHPAVAEAAVIGIPHEKWQERPLLILVTKDGHQVGRDQMRAFLEDKVVKWWLPDDVVCVEKLPHTATGKLHKIKLREMFAGYRLPTDE